MFERFPTPGRAQLGLLGACAAAGALGLAPGAAGAFDPLTLLGWLALCAAPAGALCAARGLELFPFAAAVPGAWVMWLLFALARSERLPPAPAWAACAVGGLFTLGWSFARRAREPVRTAGLLFLLGLLLSGASVGFGLLADGSELARAHPVAAARLVALSPLVLVLECAGLDWTHAHPQVYAGAGVEWFQRQPYRGNLAGPTVLVVGCLLAWLARARRAAPRAC